MTPRVLICDRSWPDLTIELEVLGGAGLAVVESPSADEGVLSDLAASVSAIMTCFARVTARVIAAPAELKIVARFGTGVDMIDVEAAARRGAVVTNVPDYCSDEVAEHTLSLILGCTRGTVAYDRSVRNGAWGLDPRRQPRRFAGSTLGVIGFGKIGRAVVAKASALGARVLVYSRFTPAGPIAAAGGHAVTLDELLASSDVVSIHVPLDSTTDRLVDGAFIAKMRSGAFLVNTSRGAVVDEGALAHALDQGHLAGAALDVMAAEPPSTDSPLLRSERTILTPHIAFYSPEAVATMRRLACEDVVRALTGRPVERPVAL